MCWKKTEIKDEKFSLIKVHAGSNTAAVEYAGIYMKTRNKDEYFKLGTDGFHTLSLITSSDNKRQGWGFKKHFSNYDYISMSETDYAIYANPFRTGYGDSLLTIQKETLYNDPSFSRTSREPERKEKRKESGIIKNFLKNLAKPFFKKEKKEDFLKQSTSHEKFLISNDIPTPTIKDTLINNGLYKEEHKKVDIEWGKQDATGYRLEIFREERGEYKCYIYDLKENQFSFNPEGGNYFYRVKCFVKNDRKQFIHGPYSESKKFTKLYPGGCVEENITIHFNKYQDKNVYAKIDGVWYGTGYKYGEPRSIVNFPCPVRIEEYDFENNPKYIITNLTRGEKRIVNSIKTKDHSKEEINKKYANIKINEGTIISCKDVPF